MGAGNRVVAAKWIGLSGVLRVVSVFYHGHSFPKHHLQKVQIIPQGHLPFGLDEEGAASKTKVRRGFCGEESTGEKGILR